MAANVEESNKRLFIIAKQRLEDKIQFQEKEAKDKLNQQLLFFQENIESKKKTLQTDIKITQNELDELRLKCNAINEQLQREAAQQNEIDFHRIKLDETSKEDISYLISIEKEIHNKELLHKLIWSEYIQKPFNQMINNNFGSKIPKNVIYCIEEITTKKKYIGKTTAEVSKRWTDHLKNSLNIGTIKQQPIHQALYKNWDNFTFTVLEEVKNDNLNEKEKFYINFFQSDKFGFNVKSGG